MNQHTVNFATFCHKGDIHRLNAPGHLQRLISSNNYHFHKVIVVHQLCDPIFHHIEDDPDLDIFPDVKYGFDRLAIYIIDNLDFYLKRFKIDPDRPQYASKDNPHYWKYHVVNHLAAMHKTQANYIVFADNDCWMVRQPPNDSWVRRGIEILESQPDIFIVSPNDGEPERQTQRFSQQMFLTRAQEFRQADFNQPNWDGNVNVPGGPLPEYWGMLEGRMELHCRRTGQFRYVLGPEYRYYHFNKLTEEGLIETDMEKY